MKKCNPDCLCIKCSKSCMKACKNCNREMDMHVSKCNKYAYGFTQLTVDDFLENIVGLSM